VRPLPSSSFIFVNSASTAIRALSDSSKVHPPKLVQYDQWGRRIDDLQTSEGWRELKALVQKEGLPAIFYERMYGDLSRVVGFAKIALMVGDTNEVRYESTASLKPVLTVLFQIFCPMSMTDGTARVIELSGSPKMKQDLLPRLISRDPAFAFTSGQWMTEVLPHTKKHVDPF